MERQLEEILTGIELMGNLSETAMAQARSRQEVLAKPTGALGELEEISIKLAGITGQVKNHMTKQAIAIFSADNGVVEEGVASAPQSVTLSQTINFTRRLTGVSSMAKYFDIDLLVVDVGVKLPIPEELYCPEMIEHQCSDVSCLQGLTKRIVNRRIGDGTKNLAKEPAMSRQEAIRAILTGAEAVEAIKRCGYDIFGVGEMGIGNTTTSACVLASLLNKKATEVVGRGGGLTDAGLARKLEIVDEAAAACASMDTIDILANVGGFDICAMVGAFLGAAYYKLPVVIDGYISAVAALAAYRLVPAVSHFMFGSHVSKEQGYVIAMDALGIKPYFNLGMRLGEGSGCPISFKIIETACAAMNGMATFDEGAIDADYLQEAKKGNFF
ncbi:MAG: nicotinate-nucleotide--dimethylbenzimidazole phosphoribosyltransferase [Firmicutes bacterium]|jgi:nicotinate-nucleotide--dimethylbenzimidazole phosphoribosyltransferase|nr:nicotinate-nucleotide--dimethylbenzimidazole phosphoribosyltransferase [Bacillota bacterium]